MTDLLTREQWQRYQTVGYLHLGSILDRSALAALQQRMDDLAAGRIGNPGVRFAAGISGGGEDGGVVASASMIGDIQLGGLESDALVWDLIRREPFRDIAARTYGGHASISLSGLTLVHSPSAPPAAPVRHQESGSSRSVVRCWRSVGDREQIGVGLLGGSDGRRAGQRLADGGVVSPL